MLLIPMARILSIDQVKLTVATYLDTVELCESILMYLDLFLLVMKLHDGNPSSKGPEAGE